MSKKENINNKSYPIELKNVLFKIENSPYSRITNKNLIAISGCSESTLLRLFKKYLGMTPLTWILMQKIQVAMKLLQFTNLRIKEISNKVGFTNPNYFAKVFKQFNKISPREYRRKHF